MALCTNVNTVNMCKRYYSMARNLSNSDIRKRFLDYFIKENAHSFICSSPVAPLHDKSLAFVNAGMNQFKEVLLDNVPPPSLRAANSQKCIRVGGKHNDLKDVGLDSYHHTFFEMLGNWSFGDYFKREACELAWRLLTFPPYSIDPRRLYVTYFSGSSKDGLPPDLETKEIWQSLGVKSEHILPFGAEHNLWEMGRTGPCGVCTEIHVDHEGDQNAASRVNQGFSDVMELWNIVFIQYNRNEDGTLSSLPRHHVDTGMGFERLVALLQDKRSNYDTDLFTPLFDTISKVSKVTAYRGRFSSEDEGSLDTAYRMLADHSRMAAVAIADNMFPDHNYKLRKVIRKALLVAEDSFKVTNAAKLIKEVCNTVAEILSPTYPEIGTNLKKVHLVLDHEWELMRAVRGSTEAEWQKLVCQDPRLAPLVPPSGGSVGLVPAYLELRAVSAVNSSLALRLYKLHGLPVDVIEELCQALSLEFNFNDLMAKLAEEKEHSRLSTESGRIEVLSRKCLEELRRVVPVTDDSAKYQYTYSEEHEGKAVYVFPEVRGVIQAVIKEGEIVPDAHPGERVGVVLDKTCLYCEAGGQQSDRGTVAGDGWTLDCDSVLNYGGYVLHTGVIRSSSKSQQVAVRVGVAVRVTLEEERRLANTRHHTATHCLNAALHQMFDATHQKGSSVTEDFLVYDFATYGQHCTNQHIKEVEDRVQQMVKSALPVTRKTVSSTELLSLMNKITFLPGETYPSRGIHVVTIHDDNYPSQEACCGTHVLNTRDLGDFCVCQVRHPSTGVRSVTAVAGTAAHRARLQGQTALSDANLLNERVQSVKAENAELEDMDSVISSMKTQVLETLMPFHVRTEVLSQLENMSKQLREVARGLLRQTMEEEMKDLLARTTADYNKRYLVHCLRASSQLDKIPLMKATKMCPVHLPVLIFAYAEGVLKARCVVPKVKVSPKATAQAWLEPVLAEVGGSGGPPRGQDPRLVYNMKPLRVPAEDINRVVTQAITEANRVAKQLFDD